MNAPGRAVHLLASIFSRFKNGKKHRFQKPPKCYQPKTQYTAQTFSCLLSIRELEIFPAKTSLSVGLHMNSCTPNDRARCVNYTICGTWHLGFSIFFAEAAAAAAFSFLSNRWVAFPRRCRSRVEKPDDEPPPLPPAGEPSDSSLKP